MDQDVEQGFRIAFVQSNWHTDIVGQARAGFEATLEGKAEVEIFIVPGAFELPLHVRTVADAVISGLMRVQLDIGVPVFSSVLTPQQFHESEDHHKFFMDHMLGKGREVAATCSATLEARQRIAT